MHSAITHSQTHLTALAMLFTPPVCDGQFNSVYEKKLNRGMEEFADTINPRGGKDNLFALDATVTATASSNPTWTQILDEDTWQFWQRSNVSGETSGAGSGEIVSIARLARELISQSITRGTTDNGGITPWFDVGDIVSLSKSVEDGSYHDYEERIEYLRSVGLDEDIQIDDMSEKDFLSFTSSIMTKERAMLALLDEGQIGAVWKAHGDQLALEFLGDGTVDYGIFQEGRYGSCTIEDAKGILKSFLGNSREAYEKTSWTKGKCN